jgi:hypothetical protein
MAVEKSGDRELVTLVRVYLSDAEKSSERAAISAAERLELRFGVKGSSVQEQLGRWDGETELGHVVEISVPFQGAYANLGKMIHEVLQPMVKSYGLTFYVTLARDVVAMEVF